MKIQVRKCGFTRKLFESDTDYVRHLKSLRQDQKRAREIARRQATWNQLLCHAQHTCDSFESLATWIGHIQHQLQMRVNPTRMGKLRGIKLGFEFKHMRFQELHSNSHSAPRGGITNWSRNRNNPMGYPAWTGTIEITGWDKYSGFWSDLLRPIQVHTGTGSCGTYEVTVWDSDWPGIRVAHSLLHA